MTKPHRTIAAAGFRRFTTGYIACCLVYACGAGSASGPMTGDDAAKAANVFTQLADSIKRSGGDSSIARAYGSLADALRTGFRTSPVTITVDGIATPFVATAQQNIFATCPGCATLHEILLPAFRPVLRRTMADDQGRGVAKQ